MDIKNFVLSYYRNSNDGFHIHKVENTLEAKKPHTHDYFQVYYIAKGSLTHFVENDSAHLTQGDMCIIPPQTIHYITPQPGTVFYSFSFMPNFLGDPNQNNRLAVTFLRNLQTEKTRSIRPKVSLASEEIFYVENIMEHILKEFNLKPFGYDETIRAYALLLVTMLVRGYFETIDENISDHFENNKQFILHCIEYMENNFTEEISLEEIARRSAMSKSCFCRIFSNVTGYTFNSYLNKLRIQKAEEYIKQGYKITAVYGLCGYNDFSTFYRNFKKIKGVSPQTYKMQCNGTQENCV